MQIALNDIDKHPVIYKNADQLWSWNQNFVPALVIMMPIFLLNTDVDMPQNIYLNVFSSLWTLSIGKYNLNDKKS